MEIAKLNPMLYSFSGRRKIWKGGIHIDPSLEILSEIIL